MKFCLDKILEVPTDETSSDEQVAFVLFLEPRPKPDPRWTIAERAINAAVSFFQPSPPLAHCEIALPPTDDSIRTNFATYLGSTASWQVDRRDGIDYYLNDNAGRWRAIPIFGKDVAARIRDEADLESGVKYSMLRYLTAIPPFRAFSRFMPDRRRSPAHCGNLTARILKNSEIALRNNSAYYGPTTLHKELSAVSAWKHSGINGIKTDSTNGAFSEDVSKTVEHLVFGVRDSEAIGAIGDNGCSDAVDALTRRAADALLCDDKVRQQVTQKQLAEGVLRWILYR